MDGEVRIPVTLDVDYDDLQKLKTEVNKITESARKLAKKRSISPVDSAALQDNLTKLFQIEQMIGKIQSSLAKSSSRSLGSDWSEAIKQADYYRQLLAQIEQDKRKAQSSLGAYSRIYSDAVKYEERMKAEMEEIRSIAQQAGRELTESEKSRLAEIQTEINLRKMLASENLIQARNRYDGLVTDEKSMQEALAEAQQRADLLSEIMDDEQRNLEYNREIESETERINNSLDKTKATYREIALLVKNILEANGIIVEGLNESVLNQDNKVNTINQLSEAEQNLAKSEQDAADTSEQEAKANENSTKQLYYKLRAVKMIGFTIDSIYKAMDKFGKKAIEVTAKALNAYLGLIPGVNALKKALSKTSSEHKKLNREIKRTTVAQGLFNLSLKDALKFILKYAFGIRSVYILVRKIRSAIKEGLGEMSKQFDDVNVRMSSILTSINYIKATITTIAEPLLTLIAPALEKVAELVANIAYHVASFFAALSGQKYVYKAIKVQADYAESLDKTAKNAKKAKKELAGFDELNVLHSNDDDEDKATMGWELVPVLAEAFPLIDKIKEILAKIFDPIKKAWEEMKEFLLDAWNTMVEKLKSLLGTIWDDFLKVWTDGRVQKIFEDIFKIIGDILLIIGNLAEAIEEAWKHNDNGYRILSSIVDILGIIVQGLKDCADATVEWSEKLSFVPLFDAIADVLEQQVVPAVQKVVDLLVYLYEHIILEIARYVVEELVPTIVRAFGNIAEVIGNIAENIKTALETDDLGDKIVTQFERLVTIVSDKILEVSEKTKEWSKDLDFTALFEAVLQFLERIEPAVQAISDILGNIWTEVLLPFWEYIIEEGGPKLLDILGQILGQKDEETGLGIDWEKVTEDINNLLSALEQFLELAWDTLLEIIKDIGQAFDDFVNSETFSKIIEGFKDWVNNADPEELATKLEKFAIHFTEAYVAFKLISTIIMPVITGIMTFANLFAQVGWINSINGLTTALGGGAAAGGAAAGGAAAGGGGLAGALGGLMPAVLIAVAAITLIVGAFGGVKETIAEIKERIDEVGKSFAEFAEQIGLNETWEKLKESFSGMGESLQKLRPLFEFLFDVIAEIATVIGKTLIGALDGLITMVTGVIDIFSGLFDILGSVIDFIIAAFSGDDAGVNAALTEFEEGVGKVFWGISEIVEGVFLGITEALAGFIDEVLPGISKGVTDFCESVKEGFEWLKYHLVGDPIVLDMEDDIEESFSGWISETGKSVSEWVTDRVDDFKELANDLVQPVKNIGTSVVNGFNEFKEGAEDKVSLLKNNAAEKFMSLKDDTIDKITSLKDGATEGFTALKDMAIEGFTALKEGVSGQSDETSEDVLRKFTEMVKNLKETINIDTLKETGINFISGFVEKVNAEWKKYVDDMTKKLKDNIQLFTSKLNIKSLANAGKDFITGLYNAISSTWKKITSFVTTSIRQIISEFESKLSLKTLFNVGANLLEGLKNGLISKLQSILSEVTNICNQIVSATKAAFKEHSPSKIFEEIGKNLILGLAEGIDGTANVAYESLKEIYDNMINQSEDLVLRCQIEGYDSVLNVTEQKIKDIKQQINDLEQKGIDANNARSNAILKWNAELGNVFSKRGMTNFEEFYMDWDKVLNHSDEYLKDAIRQKSSWFKEGDELATEKALDDIVKELKDFAKQTKLNYESLSEYNNIKNTSEYKSLVNQLTLAQQDFTAQQKDLESFLSDKLQSVINAQNTLNKYATNVPSIAKGSTLPSTTAFYSSSTQNSNENLVKDLKGALIESMENMRYNEANNQEIVIQIDGYEVFRAIRNQNDNFVRATGYSGF